MVVVFKKLEFAQIAFVTEREVARLRRNPAKDGHGPVLSGCRLKQAKINFKLPFS